MKTTRDSHPSFRLPPPTCPHCGKSLPASSPRVQLGMRWFCPDGAYLTENPEAPRLTKPRSPREPQREQLPFEGDAAA